MFVSVGGTEWSRRARNGRYWFLSNEVRAKVNISSQIETFGNEDVVIDVCGIIKFIKIKLNKKRIMKEYEHEGKRVVMFNEGVNDGFERPSFELLSYADYLKREAEKRGMVEKMGMMVDSQTRKADRGQECEQALLGRCNIKRTEKVPVPINTTAKTYQMAKDEIFEFTKKHQPAEDEHDQENVSREIEQMIKEKIDKSDLPKPVAIKFYTAIGTPLDYQYGIDGWVEILKENGKKELITFDLKTGNYVNSSIEADIMLKLDLKEDGFTPKETLNELFKFTNEVVDVYRERVAL